MTHATSKRPSKQRVSRNAALHQRARFLRVTLSKPLRKEMKVRNMRVRKGDTVKIMKGEGIAKTGKVDRVNVEKGRVFVTGFSRKKGNGVEILVPIQPSNLMITELDKTDAKRFEQKSMAKPKKKTEGA